MPRKDERRNYLRPSRFRSFREAFNCPICGGAHPFPEEECDKDFCKHRDKHTLNEEMGILYIPKNETRRMNDGLELQELFEEMLECDN